MADIKTILFVSKKNKKGQSPVVLRLTHNRQRKYFFHPYHCLEDQWDITAGRFKRTFPDYKRVNDILRTKEQLASDIIRDFERDGIHFDFKAFEIRYLKQDEQANLESYFKSLIEKLNAAKDFGSETTHKNTLSAITRFVDSQKKRSASNFRLQDIDYKFLTDFEHWLRTVRDCKDTTIGIYMRTLRSVVNKAIKEKLLKADSYPFNDYSLSKFNVKTKKRAITKDAIRLIEALELANNTKLQFARDIFLFSYYNRGINLIDIAHLTENNFPDGRLEYIRRKTNQIFSIAIKPQSKEILERYLHTKLHYGKYIFPILDEKIHQTEKQQHTRVKTVNRDINKALKIIAELAGLDGVNLTIYVGRHTYATVLKKAGVSIAIISESLGHRSEGVTHTYLKQFENSELDAADADVL
ncbi:site-specific integrase [Cytophagaceae bacterium DM2B3-1]|uniref:Site-specific integrase n=1 Tax=Xanthocytophaga flava TaxID=3048013 RepID=A0ABT7CTL3_9BACT|nr:site-specific integrase [Xanthocytophaga flavus]MDJ1497113.1 site-specific integrase [Xanthocytophaga flavus]